MKKVIDKTLKMSGPECPNRNSFCFVCGLFTPKGHRRNITKKTIEGFEKYYRMSYEPNQWYIPETVCEYCYRSLVEKAAKNAKPSMVIEHPMKYVLPTIWLRISEHNPVTCYFCLTMLKTVGFNYKTRTSVQYEDSDFVIPARLRSNDHPFAPSEDPGEDAELSDLPTTSTVQTLTSTEATTSGFVATPNELGETVRHLITQADFNDLKRDANISARSAEIIGSRFQQWNLVAPDFRVTSARKRQIERIWK